MAKQSADAKERILQAALKLFAEKGFEGTTVRDICEEAGVNVSLVSYYFGGKEKVLYALFEAYFCLQVQSGEHDEVWKDPVKGLLFLIREVIRFRVSQPLLVKILQQEIALETPRSDELRRFALPTWDKLRELLERGRSQGVFQFRSLDTAITLVMGCVLSHKANGFMGPFLQGESDEVEAFTQDTQQFVLRGLGFCNTAL
jgi:AcrR family transcriptional regulator